MTLRSLPKLHNPVNSVPQVKLYADLSAASFKDNSMDQLALWYLLRSLHNGCGDLLLDTRSQMVTLLKDFGYSPSMANRLLRKAEGRFLSVVEGKRRTVVKIYGLLTVCRSYNTTLDGDKHARLVKVEDFNSFNKRRSQLYASIFKPEGVTANPMTRETITQLTGLARIQQRRYEKTAGIKRTPNFEVEEVNGNFQTVGIEVHSKSRIYVVPRRLGNTYHSHQSPGNKGQVRSVHQALKAKRASSMTDKALVVRKCFFTSLTKVLKYFKGHQGHNDNTAFYLVRNKARRIKGRLEWCFHQQNNQAPLFNFGGLK